MTPKPLYTQLETRILELENKARQAEERVTSLQLDYDDLLSTNQQLVEAIERANSIATNSQITYIELNHIFNTDADGKCVIDKKFNVLKINKTFSKLFGIDKEKAAGKKCYDLIPSGECSSAQCPLKKILAGESVVERDVEKKSADGSTISCMMSASAFHDPGGDLYGMVISFRDITDRKLMEEKLRELATTDGLTKIFNRRHFLELANREFERAKRYNAPLTLLTVDVDHFKNINDSFGHDIGDQVLIRLAEIMTTTLRKLDVFGRIGGEEFAILLPETALAGAECVAERLRETVEKTSFITPKGLLHISVSVGIAQVTEASANLLDLLKASDSALYQAKENGRNRVEFYDRIAAARHKS